MSKGFTTYPRVHDDDDIDDNDGDDSDDNDGDEQTRRTTLKTHSHFQGAGKNGIVRCGVADETTITPNVFFSRAVEEQALRDFEMGKAYAVRIKHTSVFDKAKNCCSIFSYEKLCLFVYCLFVHLPKLQIHEIEGFEVKEFTFLSNDKLLELRGTRPRTNKGYSVSTPSKMAFL